MSTALTMLEAVKAGDTAEVSRLLADDPTLADVRDEAGVSAVMLAAYQGRSDVAHALVAGGASLDIFAAAATGDARRVAELIEEDARRAQEFSPDGFTALGFAAFFGHKEIIAQLLAAGADPNAESQNQMRVAPLGSAVAHRSPQTSLDMAAALLVAGADANHAQAGGWTPLHQAAAHNHTEMLRLLLAHGADPHTVADDGATPLEMAISKGHEEASKVLREYETE